VRDVVHRTLTIRGSEKAQIGVVIPAKKNRLVECSIDENLYKDRNKVERYFNKLKDNRQVATRYEKTALSFAGFFI
jgi:putative transposase